MLTLSRWWTRYGFRTLMVVLTISGAWWLRSTNGVVLYEAYNLLTRPFHLGTDREQKFENSYILELQQRIIELEKQNQSLQAFSDYTSSVSGPTIQAAVIGRSADHWWQHVILNRGSRHGVEPGYVVSGPGGVVGRVVQVSPNTCRVLLISDLTSQVGAKVSRSRAMGVVQGQSNNQVVIEFFDKLPDAKVGDVVTTSSYSRVFPKDMPIGRIESMDNSRDTAPKAIIQLSSPLPILEWVVIQPFHPLESIDDLLVPSSDNLPKPHGRSS
ncbi:MAG: rod shape-determining protein MreC [Cyanobacteriota bacterium]|nr:rod shape-determining protein MreC [Cyanobacteriota bacterium]